jgi:TRAP-type C4-dicarboxylate transport system permease small subunit
MAQRKNPSSAQPASRETTRAERILAYMVFSSIGLSVLCFLAVIIGTPLGWVHPEQSVWSTIIILPLVGLPIGFVLIIVLIVLNAVRRSRDNRSNVSGGSR